MYHMINGLDMQIRKYYLHLLPTCIAEVTIKVGFELGGLIL